jgi:hypothetical protein
MDMTSNTRTRRILAGLVAAHVVLHGVALAVMFTSPGPPDGMWPYVVLVYALFMLGPSQGTLLALWLTFGRGKFLWRVVPAALGAVVYLWLFKNADPEWLASTFAHTCIWAVLLLVARLTGLELVRSSTVGSDSRRSQFYIRDMLAWMTALAVILSAMKCAPQDWLWPMTIGEAISLFGGLGLVAGASIHSALGGGWLLARIMLPPLAVGVGAYVFATVRGTTFSVWYFALLLGLMAAWLVGSLLLVRLAGYRLAWRWRFSRADRESLETGDGK